MLEGIEIKFALCLYQICSIVIIMTAFEAAGMFSGLSAITTSAISFLLWGRFEGYSTARVVKKFAGVLAALFCMGLWA